MDDFAGVEGVAAAVALEGVGAARVSAADTVTVLPAVPAAALPSITGTAAAGAGVAVSTGDD